jgi:hypothetical protein
MCRIFVNILLRKYWQNIFATFASNDFFRVFVHVSEISQEVSKAFSCHPLINTPILCIAGWGGGDCRSRCCRTRKTTVNCFFVNHHQTDRLHQTATVFCEVPKSVCCCFFVIFLLTHLRGSYYYTSIILLHLFSHCSSHLTGPSDCGAIAAKDGTRNDFLFICKVPLFSD